MAWLWGSAIVGPIFGAIFDGMTMGILLFLVPFLVPFWRHGHGAGLIPALRLSQNGYGSGLNDLGHGDRGPRSPLEPKWQRVQIKGFRTERAGWRVNGRAVGRVGG